MSVPQNGFQKPADNGRADLARSAMEYMRHSRMAIADMTISERTAPDTGFVSGTAVAINGTLLAVATAPNRFVILEVGGSGGSVAVGADFNRGRTTVATPDRGLTR